MDQSVNWNGHLLCSIDVETTGLDPEKDDLIEIAIIPLKPNLTPNFSLKPFELILRPKDPDIFSKNSKPIHNMSLAEILTQGIDAYNAVDVFETWFASLNLPERKKIMPLGHNYVNFDMKFLQNWLGPATYEHYFDYHVRDTMQVGLYLNDIADWLHEPIPFPKVGLTYMTACLKIMNIRRHRALGDALATAELFRQLVTRVGPNLITISKAIQTNGGEVSSASLSEPDAKGID